MVLGFIWPPNPPPPAHSIGHQDRHHHLIPHIPPHPYIVPRRRLQRHTLNRAITARFRVSGPQHLPWLAFANASPRDRRRLVRAIPPSPPTSLRRRLTRQNRNRATAARFRVFGPPPPPRLPLLNAPPPARRPPTQLPSPPPSQFDTTEPKPSHGGSVSGICPPSPFPASCLQTHQPTTAVVS